MGKRIVFIWLLLAFAWVAKSQNYMIKGIVTDSITGEPLPYVAVILKGTTIGATTDLDGRPVVHGFAVFEVRAQQLGDRPAAPARSAL